MANGWAVLETVDVTLAPSEEVIGGWKVLKTIDVTLQPSEEIIGGWAVLRTVDVVLIPKGYIPPSCTVDADCPAGYKCVGGKCVKEEEEEKPFPWEWLLVGGLGAGALILLVPKKRT